MTIWTFFDAVVFAVSYAEARATALKAAAIKVVP
jgi:hypothetical protein